MKPIKFKIEKHYKQICDLWEKHGWTPCPIDALPKHCYVAIHSGNVVAFMAAYVVPGSMTIFDWALADPEFQDRDIALNLIFQKIVLVSKRNKCNYLYSVTKNNKWGNKLIKYGMIVAEKGASTYIMPLADNRNTDFISD